MKVIGLTGNAAAGKTTVARIFEELSAVVIDADEVAREVVLPGSPALKELTAVFGPEILLPSGALNRRRLAERVFGDHEALTRLNQILHPVIIQLIRELIEAERARGTRMVVIDAPLIYEAGIEDWFDAVVVVDAPEAERVRRLIQWKGLSRELAQKLVAAQAPAEEKRKRTSWVIENVGTLTDLRQQARLLCDQLSGAHGEGEG